MNKVEQKSYYEVGKSYFYQGKVNKTIYWLKKSIKIDTINYESYAMIALAYLWVDKSEQSIKWFKKGMELKEGYINPIDYLQLSLAYLNLNKKGKATMCLIQGFISCQKESQPLDGFFEQLKILTEENGYIKYRYALKLLKYFQYITYDPSYCMAGIKK